jgi:hypothetical protein
MPRGQNKPDYTQVISGLAGHAPEKARFRLKLAHGHRKIRLINPVLLLSFCSYPFVLILFVLIVLFLFFRQTMTNFTRINRFHSHNLSCFTIFLVFITRYAVWPLLPRQVRYPY